ncbi:MAG: hypothetical protein HY520_03190 [Candidatus Aenigmarchaeota archaeon]|nr:hypothetical protein [Candidatus Aenigmarchaeota archaeon]
MKTHIMFLLLIVVAALGLLGLKAADGNAAPSGAELLYTGKTASLPLDVEWFSVKVQKCTGVRTNANGSVSFTTEVLQPEVLLMSKESMERAVATLQPASGRADLPADGRLLVKWEPDTTVAEFSLACCRPGVTVPEGVEHLKTVTTAWKDGIADPYRPPRVQVRHPARVDPATGRMTRDPHAPGAVQMHAEGQDSFAVSEQAFTGYAEPGTLVVAKDAAGDWWLWYE